MNKRIRSEFLAALIPSHISWAVLLAFLILTPLTWAQQNKGATRHPVVADAKQPTGMDSGTSQTGRSPTSTSRNGQDDDFVIGPDDVLAFSVWKEPEISRTVPVRSDGKISLPLVGEVVASGLTPRELQAVITTKLGEYLSEPEVTVIVQEIKSQQFNVLGQVMRPGSYPLTKSLTVLDAIAAAGGFRDFARQKNSYVIRRAPDGKETLFPFNYKQVIRGRGTNIALQPRDTVVVP